MRPFRSLLFCAALLPSVAGAQSNEVLLARSAKNTVFAEIDEQAKSLRFLSNTTDVDEVRWDYSIKEPEQLMLIKDNSYNLRLRSTNPLRYRVTVEGKAYEEDPYDKALNDLAGNVQALLTLISSGALTVGTLGSGDPLAPAVAPFDAGKSVTVRDRDIVLTAPSSNGVDLARGRAELDGLRDFRIRQAIMVLRTVTGDRRTTDFLADATVSVVVDSARAIEANASSDMIAEATGIVRKLLEVDLSSASANGAIAELERLIGQLRARNDALVAQIDNLAKLRNVISKKAEAAGKAPGAAKKNAKPAAVAKAKQEREQDIRKLVDDWAYTWSEAVAIVDAKPYDLKDDADLLWKSQVEKSLELIELSVQEFAERMTRFVEQRKVLVTNLSELLGLVQAAQKENSRTAAGAELLYSEIIPRGQTELVTVRVKKRSFTVQNSFNVSVDETDFFSYKLKFTRAHLFYPQAFPAVVFVNAAFPEFTAQEDSTGRLRVLPRDNTKGYFNVAGMVNFNFKMGRSLEVPFLQLGVSTKKSRPQFFLGGGIRLADWFCVSGGLALAWEGALNDLKEGDAVADQDAIDSDLRYSLSEPRFYASIQLRPSALTKKP